jgi:hypothetical protein
MPGCLCLYAVRHNTSYPPYPTPLLSYRVPAADAAATPATAAAAMSDRHLIPKPCLAAPYLAS